MGGSILGPGTIFLMLVGAFVAAFKIDNYTSFYINLAPLLLFIIFCYFTKAKTQLTLAKLLSVIYALVMVAVLLALVLQVVDDGLLAPSSIFLVAISLSFIISAIVHPLEADCLLHGLLYYITIPSMYLLLIIYSLFNLNDVTWGTRENPAQAADQKTAAAAVGKGKKKSFLSGLIPGLTTNSDKETDGSLDLSFAGLCRLSCCFTPKPKDDGAAALVNIQQSLEMMTKKLNTMEKNVGSTGDPNLRKLSGSTSSVTSVISVAAAAASRSSKEFPPAPTDQMVSRQTIVEGDEGQSDGDDEIKKNKLDDVRDDLMNPHWLEDSLLKYAETDFLPTVEIKFWEKMIAKYLKPIYENEEKKKKLKQELRDLRNKVVGAFFMFNAVFVTAMFLLQLNKDKLFFEWPLGGTHNMTYDAAVATVTVQTEYLHLEPLGLLFVGFYAIILVVQFVAMLFHRFGTFSHIMASTAIGFCNKSTDSMTDQSTIATNSAKTILKFQKIKHANEESEDGTMRGEGGAGRRKTIIDLHKSKNKKVRIHTLDRAFEKNFLQVSPDKLRRMSRAAPNLETTINAMVARRSTIMGRRESLVDRRQSQAPGGMDTLNTMNGFGGRRRPRFADSVSMADSAFETA